MQFLKDGKRMVSGSPDTTIAIFDLSSKGEKAIKTVK